jgi:methyltransferase (TIGR00027 family)
LPRAGSGGDGGAAFHGAAAPMLEQQASKTALGVAYIRAAHQILDTAPLLFEDPVALPLLGPNAPEAIRTTIERYQSPYGRGLRSHVCLRSRFAEDMLRQSGANRYVLVGAGFDTFALRQPDWAKGLRILEVDHPATQAAKCEMMARNGFTEPENVSFAATDFTRETLADVLGREDIGSSETVYFSWLGVTMYLTEAAIDASLAAMARVAAKAAVCLTFKQPDDGVVAGERAMADFVAALGEAFVSFFTPDQMADKLRQHGFGRQEFLTPERARADYFTPPRGGLPAPRKTGIVFATT